MLFIYISPVSITIIYTIYFALLDNVQIICIVVLSLNPRVFYILILYARRRRQGMSSIFTSHQKSIPPKYHNYTTLKLF